MFFYKTYYSHELAKMYSLLTLDLRVKYEVKCFKGMLFYLLFIKGLSELRFIYAILFDLVQ